MQQASEMAKEWAAMSAGDGPRKAMEPDGLRTDLMAATLKDAMAQPRTVNQEYDLPYLGGYSQDGKTIYLDRHFPDAIPIEKKQVDVRPFIIKHEVIEKTLLDRGGHYWSAHKIATQIEENTARTAGIDPDAYEKALAPYIKAAAKEKLERVPPDLDLAPYKAKPVNKSLLVHLEECMKNGGLQDSTSQAPDAAVADRQRQGRG